MLSYSSYILTAVAALLVTCHGLRKYSETSGLPGAPGRGGLEGQSRLPGLLEPSGSLIRPPGRSRLSWLQALDFNGIIRKAGKKIFASNGKQVDFASALQSCEEAGGTLATPTNEEENKAILDIVKQHNRYAYLGIKVGETPGQFKGINGTPLNYTKWHRNEPNGKGTEKCVEMYTDGSWNDRKCNLNRLTICEF
ncbi:pulmonary surfactant-associated protein A2-like [Aegotheles albertisi]